MEPWEGQGKVLGMECGVLWQIGFHVSISSFVEDPTAHHHVGIFGVLAFWLQSKTENIS
jgi:hypothetical protein